ncbi:MAG TPA: acyl-CoA thioesterase [Clostridiales bacterium]|nr:acyl-CoA thioesterase [Clostridiales bacterium]
MITKTKIVARYAETDKMGIVHHSVYPIWYEVGRTDFIKRFGTNYSTLEEAGMMMPLINLTCHYGLPAKYEDELIVETKLLKLSCGKITFGYSVYKQPANILIGSGTTEHGFVDSNTFKPINIKKFMPKLFNELKDSIE